MKICFSILLGLVALCSNLVAQTPASAQPIELPEFIVTGKEQVGVPGASKQNPLRPPLLAKTQLDSLNPIEKLPLPTMSGAPFPSFSRTLLTHPGWVEAQFGNYLTPSVKAGYSFETGGYLLDLAGDVELSNGWTSGSEYAIGGISAHSSYMAPEKFVVFGGSETNIDLDIHSKSYNLFARDSAPSRSQFLIGAGIGTSGSWDGFDFDAGINWRSAAISDSATRTNSDENLMGTITIMKHWDHSGLGGLLTARMSSYASQSYPFTEVGALGALNNEHMHATASAAIQWAGTTIGADRFGFGLKGAFQWYMSEELTLDATIASGLRGITVSDMLHTNPYVTDSTTVDVPYDLFDVVGTLRYHPVIRLTVAGSLRMRRTDRDLVWSRSDIGVFAPTWLATSTVVAQGSVRWLASTADAVTADLTFTSSSVDSMRTPYVAPVQASVGYDHAWIPALRTTITAVYVGERYADIANTRTLDGYVDIGLFAGYRIGSAMELFVRAENLVGSTMVIWEGYRERSVFISGGLTWRF